MDRVFSENQIDSVIHFAADIEVGISTIDPLAFYRNNVYTVMCLLENIKHHHVRYIVFSSTAAVYGYPQIIPIKEDLETLPINAYGETKLTVRSLFLKFTIMK